MPRFVSGNSASNWAAIVTACYLGLIDRKPGLEPREDLVARSFSARRGIRLDFQRCPERLADREGKFLRHHPDHSALHTIGTNRLTDHVGGAAVPVAPQLVAEKHHRVGAGAIVAVPEATPVQWLHPECLERGDTQQPAAEPLRPSFFC